MNTSMNHTLEYTVNVSLALAATFLQIQVQWPVFDIYSVGLKVAVFTGSVSYVFKAMRDEKLDTRTAIFTAFTGYTCGVYLAPALVEYYHLEQLSYVSATHYFSGGMGMWLMNIGWAVMKGAYQDAWPTIKTKLFGKRDSSNDTPDNA